MSRRRPAARLLLGAALGLAGCLAFAVAVAAQRDRGLVAADDPNVITVEVAGADGASLGEIELSTIEGGGVAEVEARLRDLPPGLNAVHVHDAADCDATRYAAGSTLDDRGIDAHALPPLLALRDGTATSTVHTDRLDVGRLVDGDGSAIVIEGPRGGRIGCGAIE